MENIDSDFFRTKLLVRRNLVHNNHSYLYFSSNEDINKIFNNFDFNNKDVLSVIGSGDQAFHFINKGVTNIDLFDKNKLSFYYLFLRMWIIDYYKKFYPDYPFNYDYFSELFNNIKPNSIYEENSLLYWKKCIDEFNMNEIGKMFFSTFFRGRNNIYNVDLLNKKIKNTNYRLYNCNIAGDINIDKKYDIIFVSNIIDHLNNIDDINIFKNNLYNLLNDYGIVIFSKVFRCPISEVEKDVFYDDFDLHTLSVNNNDECTKYLPGYYYVKRK